jgi:hypothetical protein
MCHYIQVIANFAVKPAREAFAPNIALKKSPRGLKHPLIFDFNANHKHFEEGDADSFIVVARAEPRKTEIPSSTKANDNIAVNRYGFSLTCYNHTTKMRECLSLVAQRSKSV